MQPPSPSLFLHELLRGCCPVFLPLSKTHTLHARFTSSSSLCFSKGTSSELFSLGFSPLLLHSYNGLNFPFVCVLQRVVPLPISLSVGLFLCVFFLLFLKACSVFFCLLSQTSYCPRLTLYVRSLSSNSAVHFSL